MKSLTLPVSELFSTIQGEGPDIGRPCVFLRLHGCPVHCPGCDTSYTWNGTEAPLPMPGHELEMAVKDVGANRKLGLVVSGGEPLLHAKRPELIDIIMLDYWQWVGLETSGYVGDSVVEDDSQLSYFLGLFQTISLSPKITPCLHGRQTNEQLERLMPLFADHLGQLILKFVVATEEDLIAVNDFHKRHTYFNGVLTYLMPYGNDRDEILKVVEWLVPHAIQYGYAITPRLQALVWGKRRGV